MASPRRSCNSAGLCEPFEVEEVEEKKTFRNRLADILKKLWDKTKKLWGKTGLDGRSILMMMKYVYASELQHAIAMLTDYAEEVSLQPLRYPCKND